MPKKQSNMLNKVRDIVNRQNLIAANRSTIVHTNNGSYTNDIIDIIYPNFLTDSTSLKRILALEKSQKEDEKTIELLNKEVIALKREKKNLEAKNLDLENEISQPHIKQAYLEANTQSKKKKFWWHKRKGRR